MVADDRAIAQAAGALVERLAAAGLRLATAESCTGGLVAGAITAVAGSSAVLERGFVTYSNAAKTDLLGVPEPLLAAHGAVSREVAEAMAAGALARSPVEIAVSVTGIAGPGGGSPAKPVGLVHFAAATRHGVRHREMRFGEIGRDAVRAASVLLALALVAEAANDLAEAPPVR